MAKFLCFLLIVLAPVLYGQTAELTGLIMDPSGTAIPNASVEMRSNDTNTHQQTTTNNDGLYSLPTLKPGNYLVTVQATGFKTLTRDGIVLQVEQRARLDLTLEVGVVAEKITVTGEAPLINSNDAAVSTVVDRQFVENMPLNGRSFQSLIGLGAGVVMTTSTIAGDQGQFSVAGQRAGSNYFSVDGAGANFGISNGILPGQTANGGLPALSVLGSTASLVSIDALQEFRLETSTYAPEFGRESGAQAILVTRSGTNGFHGTAFDYLRNDVFDANDWFANSTAQPKPRERQNDFGGVLGGPILKNRTFFFFSYEGLRVAQPAVSISDVPSVAARTAAPASIKPLVDAFPLPNGPATADGQAQFAASYANLSNLDATSLRIDHTIHSKVTLFGRYNHAPSTSTTRAAPSVQSPSAQTIDTGTLGLTAILTPTITNDFRFNYSRAQGSDGWYLDNFGGAIVPPSSDIVSSWQSLATGWAYVQINNGRNEWLAVGNTAENLNRQLNITDNVGASKGTHVIKLGVDFRRLTPVLTENSTDSQYYWTSAATFASGGLPYFSRIILDPNALHLDFHNFSAFAQDTWKATRRLTLTYGVRWDYNPPPSETSGHAPYVISEINDLPNSTLLPPGTPLWHADWKNFAPRVGVSYLLRPKAARPTVLRAGFGQFFDLGTSTAGFLDTGRAQGWYPYSVTTVLCLNGVGPSCNTSIPYTGPQPPFVFPQPYPAMRGFDPHLKLPYSLQWNFALEQSLSPNQTLKVTYVGSAGRRLLRDDDIRNPNPILAELYLTRNSAYSNYESLQLQLQRRLSRGLQALMSYAWSHSLDLNSSDIAGGWYATTLVPSNLYNIRQDYGSSDFDVRHTFSAALTYNIPTPHVANSFLRSALSNWSVDSINSARTGLPFNALYSPANPGAYVDGSGQAIQLRPDQVSGQPIYLSDPNVPGGKGLNPTAFTIPAVVRQGSEGRNNIRGFPLLQVDAAVRRQFHLTERVSLQLRAEGFNFINHPNFGLPLNLIGTSCAPPFQCSPTPGWGTAQAMLNQSMSVGGYYANGFSSLYQVGGPRSLQLSAKLQF